MTERLSHKRDCLYKDKITCSKSHLFVLEKTDYTYKHTVIRQAGQPTHLPVICSIPSSLQKRIIAKKKAQERLGHIVYTIQTGFELLRDSYPDFVKLELENGVVETEKGL